MHAVNVFPFQSIIDYLKCGREIEFSYKGKQYSITNSNGYWNFCCDTENCLIEKICSFENKDKLITKVKSYSIDGTLISEIFDENRYDPSSVCIL